MTDQPLRLSEILTDGAIVLDGHTLADAQAHWEGEDAEMMRRFDSIRKATVEEIRGAMQRWMDGRANGGPMFTYAMRWDGKLVGGCEVRWLETPDGALNVSYWSYPEYRGHGLVGRAVTLMMSAVAMLPGARQIEAHVDPDNAASRRVAERAGFTEHGTVIDDVWTGEKVTRVRYVKPLVHGVDLDGETRCAHWRSKLDIIAIKMKCCRTYYACKDCHDALAEHDAAAWPRAEWGEKAVLCGACGGELSVRQYLDCGNVCPACGAGFNPGCRNHYHFYFEQ